jgi:hypothetical protein
VTELSPTVLLANPELVAVAAPWCVWLDNLELCSLLLAQPWLAGEGVRRADLERQLARLGAVMPIGPVYFQRVSRAVGAMEARGQMRGAGSGRERRFVVTPAGFAALILNLQVLRCDPTVDGSEFELKRALVAVWNVVLDRVRDWPSELAVGPEVDLFLDEVEAVAVWGQRVITDEVVANGLSILRLTELQRGRVEELLAAAEAQVEGARAADELARRAGPARLDAVAQMARRGAQASVEGLLLLARSLATFGMPQLAARASALRYRAYLGYLDSLAGLYARELRAVDLAALRRLAGGRAG